jgi:hypothetical protein
VDFFAGSAVSAVKWIFASRFRDRDNPREFGDTRDSLDRENPLALFAGLVMNPPEVMPVAMPVRMSRGLRLALCIVVLGLITVFITATRIDPYRPDGTARDQATHTQLGLAPCSMMVLLGKPCPACGMTTAFALLIRGDMVNALRANWAGVLLAIIWIMLIPWGLVSIVLKRTVGVRNLELTATVVVGVLLTLMLIRWAFVMLA